MSQITDDIPPTACSVCLFVYWGFMVLGFCLFIGTFMQCVIHGSMLSMVKNGDCLLLKVVA